MYNEEFEKVKNSIGTLLAFNNLLSTSSNREISVRFAQTSVDRDDRVAVLFEMHIDPTRSSTPFASLTGISYFPAEAETLFFMHSVFRVRDIEQMPSGIWRIEIAMTDDDDNQLRTLTNCMRNQIRGPNAMHRLASYMVNIRAWDQAKEIYDVLYQRVPPSNRHELALIEHNLGLIYEVKDDLDRAVTHFQKSLTIDRTYLPIDHPQLAPSYAGLAGVYEKQGKVRLAMEHHQLAIDIELKSPCPDREKIALRYVNLGDYLRERGRLSEARKYLEDALQMQIDILPATHPSLKTTYGHLVDVCYLLGDYSTTLAHASKELNIAQKCYSANHMSIAIAHNHVSAALDKLNRCEEALHEAEIAVRIGRHTYPLGHPETRAIDNSLNVLRLKNRQAFGGR